MRSSGDAVRGGAMADGVAMHDAGPSTQTLDVLIGRMADGDHDAFAQLYEQVSRRVHALVLRVVRNQAISAEVVQEVFLMLWVSADRYKAERGSPEAWVFTLAHRRAVDRVRSEQRSAVRDVAYAQKEAVQEPVDEQVHHTLMSESVKRCLASLTDLQAEAIRLAYYGGLTYTEVAEALDVKVPTAKSRIRTGMVRLRSALEADGYGASSR